jgi:hypothetical protein
VQLSADNFVPDLCQSEIKTNQNTHTNKQNQIKDGNLRESMSYAVI